MPNTFRKRLIRRLRSWADWRCQEPVIVFESDDWGMERRECGEFIRNFAVPGDWADEETETADDLEHLYRVLERHRDPEGRSASFTANFVVANPDFDGIARDRFVRYYDRPIGQNDQLKKHWVDGFQRGVFLPQYHGRSHFSTEAWLRDLRDGIPGARLMFDRRYHGGLSLVRGEDWRYHSEYICWSTGEEQPNDELRSWLDGGLRFFHDVFGFSPRSTIATHYILTQAMANAWSAAGGEFVQGTNYRIMRGPEGRLRSLSHTLGERSPEGLLLMGRNVKFDPRPQRSQHGVKFAFREIKRCFESQVPAVIDTHRINFTGRWGSQSIEALDSLLCALRPYRPRFLTTVELGEAIEQHGSYHDVWTGERHSLKPLDPVWRKLLRVRFRPHNVELAANATMQD